MRMLSMLFSSAASEEKYFAMPASRSQRSPRSKASAASSVSSRAARARVAISPSLSWIAWCSQSVLPKGLRVWGEGGGEPQRALGEPDAARRDIDAAQFEAARHLGE